MKSWFLERGYPKQMIDSQMGKVKFGQRLKAGSKQTGFGVWFAITYHPKPKKIIQIMKKLEYLLYQEEVFAPPPMVFGIYLFIIYLFSSYLVCAKLYPLETKKGS